jgi:Spy/CpxP family protein refolding chaperone
MRAKVFGSFQLNSALEGVDRLKKKLMLLTLSLAMLLAFGQVAWATGSGNCDRPNGSSCQNQNWVPLAQQLNLSDRQVQQIKEINLSSYQTAKGLKVKLLDAKFELRQLQITGTDKTAINAKVKEIKELKTKIHEIRQQKWQKIQSILTAEQKSKLKDVKGFGHHGGRYRESGQKNL